MKYLNNSVDLLLGAGVLGLMPLMAVQVDHLAAREHLQFFPLAWIFVVYIIYSRGKFSGEISAARRVLGSICLSASILLAVFAVLKLSPWASHVALIGLLAGWMQIRLRGNHYHQFLVWLGIFAITLPLPMNLDSRLIQRLQSISTQSASSLMDLMAVPHFAQGNVLEIRLGELFVDEACSGVDSLYALIAIALMQIAWQERSAIMIAVILPLVPAWAWLGNVVRIFLISFLLDTYGMDLSHGVKHTILGLVIFGFSFVCLFYTQNAFERLLAPFKVRNIGTTMLHHAYSWAMTWPNRSPISTKKRKEDQSIQTEVESSPWALPLTYLMTATFLLCGLTSLFAINGIGPWKSPDLFLPEWTREDIESVFSEEILPERMGAFSRSKFDITHREYGDILGGHSATWIYANYGQQMQISADFPFSGFHTLEGCYIGSGRQLLAPIATLETIDADGIVSNITEARLGDDLEISYLWYLNFDVQGVSVGAIESAFLGGAFKHPPVVYQMQVYIRDCGVLTDEQKEEFKQILLHSRKLILPRIQELQAKKR